MPGEASAVSSLERRSALGCTGSRRTCACGCSSSGAAIRASPSTRISSRTLTRCSSDVVSPAPGPDEAAEERERIGLAFVTAMQLLPPKQRVTVVLRDVLDWSAREVADLLDDSVPAVNSALQRGRDRLQRERQERTLTRAHAPTDVAAEAAGDATLSGGVGGGRHRRPRLAPRRRRLADDAAGGRSLRGQRSDRRHSSRPSRSKGASTGSGSYRARANGQPALAAYADEQSDGVVRRLRCDGVRNRRRPDRRDHGIPAPARTLRAVSASRARSSRPRGRRPERSPTTGDSQARRRHPGRRIGLIECTMVGALAFMLDGDMCCGIAGQLLVAPLRRRSRTRVAPRASAGLHRQTEERDGLRRPRGSYAAKRSEPGWNRRRLRANAAAQASPDTHDDELTRVGRISRSRGVQPSSLI